MMRPLLAILLVAVIASYAHGHTDDAVHDHTDGVQDLAQKEEEVAHELKVAAEDLSDLAKTETAPETAAGLRGTTSKRQAEIEEAEAAALEALSEEQYEIAETEMAKYFQAQEQKVARMREKSHEIEAKKEEQTENNP